MPSELNPLTEEVRRKKKTKTDQGTNCDIPRGAPENATVHVHGIHQRLDLLVEPSLLQYAIVRPATIAAGQSWPSAWGGCTGRGTSSLRNNPINRAMPILRWPGSWDGGILDRFPSTLASPRLALERVPTGSQEIRGRGNAMLGLSSRRGTGPSIVRWVYHYF